MQVRWFYASSLTLGYGFPLADFLGLDPALFLKALQTLENEGRVSVGHKNVAQVVGGFCVLFYYVLLGRDRGW